MTESFYSLCAAVFFTLNLALAYMKRKSFFFKATPGQPAPSSPKSPSSRRRPSSRQSPGESSSQESFYNAYELLSVPEETGLRLVMQMCGMVNAPSRFSRFKINPVHSKAHPDSLMALVCDALMALLISIRTGAVSESFCSVARRGAVRVQWLRVRLRCLKNKKHAFSVPIRLRAVHGGAESASYRRRGERGSCSERNARPLEDVQPEESYLHLPNLRAFKNRTSGKR